MRCLAALALAGALTAVGWSTAALPSERTAMMSATDVLRAMRCAPPIRCSVPRKQKPRPTGKRGKSRASIKRM